LEQLFSTFGTPQLPQLLGGGLGWSLGGQLPQLLDGLGGSFPHFPQLLAGFGGALPQPPPLPRGLGLTSHLLHWFDGGAGGKGGGAAQVCPHLFSGSLGLLHVGVAGGA